jgi:hypothetical protein
MLKSILFGSASIICSRLLYENITQYNKIILVKNKIGRNIIVDSNNNKYRIQRSLLDIRVNKDLYNYLEENRYYNIYGYGGIKPFMLKISYVENFIENPKYSEKLDVLSTMPS